MTTNTACSRSKQLSLDQISNALKAFDVLFPLPGGNKWIATFQGVSYGFVKLVPVAFQGLGAAVRKGTYDLKSLFEISKSGDYTGQNLSNRNNHLVEFLA